GTTSAGAIAAAAGGGFTVTGAHTYAAAGAYTATAAVTDAGGGSAATAATPVAVADAALTAAGGPALALVEGSGSGPVVVATFTDADPGGVAPGYRATIAWGDGTTSAGAVTATPTAGVFQVVGSHTYAAAGAYTATAAVTDAGGGSAATAATPVAVADAALTAAAAPPIGATEGSTTGPVVVATFTDADPGGVASGYRATIAWGDGTTSAGAVTATPTAGVFQVVGSHT